MPKHNDKAHCLLGGSYENNIGYCKLHRCNVTAKQMKNRKCLQKGCRHFRKHLNHPYWVEREAAKAEKKRRKQDESAAAERAEDGGDREGVG